MKNRFLLIVVSLLFSGTVSAQVGSVKWSVAAQPADGGVVEVVFDAQIQSSWHMYDLGPYDGMGPNPTRIVMNDVAGVELVGQPYHIGEPKRAWDDMFGMEIGYFEHAAKIAQRVRLAPDAGNVVLSGYVEWMVCNDTSCSPPQEWEFSLALGGQAAATAAGAGAAGTQVGTNTAAGGVANDSSAAAGGNDAASAQTAQIGAEGAANGTLWSSIIEAILWGFVALLTPCIFPMVPVTVSFFLKGAENKGKGRFRAIMYGVFIVALYTIPIGVIIAVTWLIGGDSVTTGIFNWIATHWLPNSIFFIVFLVFAASFFGAFEIRMPSKLVNRSDSKAEGKGLGGVFFMALTLVLVSFSCTGPIVGSVLIESTSGAFWQPILTMLVFSTAFALPFTLLALFPSLLDKLPKSGGWLNSVKVVLGFVELALSLKFISIADQTYQWGLLDREVYLAMWIVIFSMLGFYLLGKLHFKHDSEVHHIGLVRLVLSIATFSFVVYMVPGMWGAPLKALSGYLPPVQTQDFVLDPLYSGSAAYSGGAVVTSASEADGHVARRRAGHPLPYGLSGYYDFEEALTAARKAGKPVFVDFTGLGCTNCRAMEARVWSDPEVLALLRNEFVIAALYMDERTEVPESEYVVTASGRKLTTVGQINTRFGVEKFGVVTQPAYIIVGHDGQALLPLRGYNTNIPAYVDFLKSGLAKFKEVRGR